MVIGLHDRKTADPVGRGELANRGKPCADRRLPRANHVLDLINELFLKRYRLQGIKGDFHGGHLQEVFSAF